MFQWREVKAKAYHEAGHVVAAVLQGLNLAEGGMRIDDGAQGVARLCIREHGNLANTEKDQAERRASIVTLLAGRFAQLRYDSYSDDPICWSDDFGRIDGLMAEMGLDTQSVMKQLSDASESIVARNWPLVAGLAELLLSAPISTMTQDELNTGWFTCFMKCQKHLSSERIRNFFQAKGYACEIS